MKPLHSILIVSLFTGCATQKAARISQPTEVLGTTIATQDMPEVRTAEAVKAYPVGRYSDPNFPDEMHERHTLYRREDASTWNYQSSQPYALSLGPVVAASNPSPSYFIQADSEQVSSQQKAYADALQEQNRAMKKRIEALQQYESAIKNLEQENKRLKKERAKTPLVEPAPTPEANPGKPPGFSFQQPVPSEDSFSDSEELMLFPQSEADHQAFLLSQMHLNDHWAQQVDALEHRAIRASLGALLLFSSSLEFPTKTTP